MTQFSLPFPGTTPNDAGPYSSAQWARVWRTIQSGILRDNAGPIINTGNGSDEALFVEETGPASTQVQVNIGAALVIGYWYESDAIVNVQVAPNNDASGDDRIDLIILRLDITNKQTRLAILEGTVAPVPVAPTLTQTATVWEVQIAEIAVANGFASIVDANIDNTVRDYAILWPQQMGGTGFESYTEFDHLVADSTGFLVRKQLAASSVGFAALGTLLGTAAWGTVDCIEVDDPLSLISVAGNVITFAESGQYLVSDFWAYLLPSGASQLQWRFRDTATGASWCVSPTNLVTGAFRSDWGLSGPFVVENDGDTFEIQLWPDDQTMRLNTPDALTNASGETTYCMKLALSRIG